MVVIMSSLIRVHVFIQMFFSFEQLKSSLHFLLFLADIVGAICIYFSRFHNRLEHMGVIANILPTVYHPPSRSR